MNFCIFFYLFVVVQQYYEVQVYDEFVIVDNTAVLKCNIPTFVKDYVTVAEWLKRDTRIIHSSPLGGNFRINNLY